VSVLHLGEANAAEQAALKMNRIGIGRAMASENGLY
jgi:hypothetical protein